MRPLLDPALGPVAEKAAAFGLCARCLGRCFAKVDQGLGNDERGELVAKSCGLALEHARACHVCQGLFERLDTFASVVAEALVEVEFSTFLVGTRVDFPVHEREGLVWATAGAERTEGVNSELNREIGKRLVARHGGPGSCGWEVDFRNPDVTAVLDTRFDHVALHYKSLLVYGRYLKHTRGIPQTHWPCGKCHGKGCVACGATGKQYATSVEELLCGAARAASGASESKFHGAGREDIDARCLGTGRPYIIEMVDPRRRFIDLNVLRLAMDADARPHAETGPMMFVAKGAIERVKEATGGKAYEADVEFDEALPTETLLKVCHMLSPARVAQRTPSRVSHRRADKVRPKEVALVRVMSQETNGLRARLLIEGDAGLYIKELISGDGGRTEPSLAGLLGVGARCAALDVVRVEGPEGFDGSP